jgi:hypothetical protein
MSLMSEEDGELEMDEDSLDDEFESDGFEDEEAEE